jgi:error-prone DNA polymerase
VSVTFDMETLQREPTSEDVATIQRRELVRSRLLAVQGTWQRDVESGGEVRHLIATRLRDLTPLLGDLMTGSRDFR